VDAGAFECALCQERIAAVRVMDEANDGVPLCQSCFGLLLKTAAHTPKHRKLEQDYRNKFDEHLA
jgi:hypothetical protein